MDKFFYNSIELKKDYTKKAAKNKEIEEEFRNTSRLKEKDRYNLYLAGEIAPEEYYSHIDYINNLFRQYGDIPDNSTLKNLYLKTLDKDMGNYLSYLGLDPNTSFISLLYRYARRHIPVLLDEAPLTINTKNTPGTDIIDLSLNTLRVTDPKQRYKNILFNEFVENRNPSVRKASEYKSGENFQVGDLLSIPRSNLTYFAGIENGKFKIGPIDIFLDNTIVYPARNIKKNLKPITKINIESTSNKKANLDISRMYYANYPHTRDLWKLEKEIISPKLLEELENATWDINIKDYEEMTDPEFINSIYAIPVSEAKKLINMGKTNTIDYQEIARLESQYNLNGKDAEYIVNCIRDFPRFSIADVLGYMYVSGNPSNSIELDLYVEDFRSKSRKYHRIADEYNSNLRLGNSSETSYTYTDTNGETHPISDWNASILDNKMVIGNPEGSLFIGRFLDINQELLDSLNARLAKSPGYLIRPDLGSFDTYRTDSTDLTNYLRLYFEHPDLNDPNLYVVGNNNPLLWRKQGGKLNYLNYFNNE